MAKIWKVPSQVQLEHQLRQVRRREERKIRAEIVRHVKAAQQVEDKIVALFGGRHNG